MDLRHCLVARHWLQNIHLTKMNPLEPFENDLQEMPLTRPIGYQLYHNSEVYPWAVYCDRPTQLYLKGRGRGGGGGQKSCGGTLSRGFGLRSFRPEITPEISAWGVFFWPEIYCEGPLYEYEYGFEYWFTDS